MSMDDEMTVEMRRALDDVVATYGDSSPTSVAERVYWAIDNAAREEQTRRLDNIEADVATLVGHIAAIKATLGEIAAGQQAQAQAAAVLGDRVDAVEQATTTIRAVMSAHEVRVGQVSASMSELRLAARDVAAAIIMRPKG